MNRHQQQRPQRKVQEVSCEFLKASDGRYETPGSGPTSPIPSKPSVHESSSAPVVSGCNYQLFATASQFRTTDIGAVSACLTFVLMRKCLSIRANVIHEHVIK